MNNKKIDRIKKNELQFKQEPKKQLKRPLQVKCFKCSASFEVKYNPGYDNYVKKNN
ncbi:MAG: hypothetical protein NY202_05705 [Mollicutes bacterium UO1]